MSFGPINAPGRRAPAERAVHAGARPDQAPGTSLRPARHRPVATERRRACGPCSRLPGVRRDRASSEAVTDDRGGARLARSRWRSRDGCAARGSTSSRRSASRGFRIDLGVRDPRPPDRFLLGVECDGATYHSPRRRATATACAQEVLEGLGWRLHRIWSTDWFQNPQGERQRLLDRLTAEIGERVAGEFDAGHGCGNRGQIDDHRTVARQVVPSAAGIRLRRSSACRRLRRRPSATRRM